MKTRLQYILLDTNLLVLWLVARTDPGLLETFKRVQMFTYEDVKLLRMIMSEYRETVSTPHVLSETSNFVDQAPQHRRLALIGEMKKFIDHISEVYQPSKQLIGRLEFDQLGLTDTGLVNITDKVLILTTDYRLAGQIRTSGGEAVNLNDLRSRRMAAIHA